VYHLPNSSEAFVEWMSCMQTGGTMTSCSGMADNLFPLSFWRDVTADTARASFGIIFFIVEVTKGCHQFLVTDLTIGIFGERFENDIHLR